MIYLHIIMKKWCNDLTIQNKMIKVVQVIFVSSYLLFYCDVKFWYLLSEIMKCKIHWLTVSTMMYNKSSEKNLTNPAPQQTAFSSLFSEILYILSSYLFLKPALCLLINNILVCFQEHFNYTCKLTYTMLFLYVWFIKLLRLLSSSLNNDEVNSMSFKDSILSYFSHALVFFIWR